MAVTSPFVRRRRLGAELRTLREGAGLTAEALSALIHQNRMKITRLENAQIRPDLCEIMIILEALNVVGDKWDQIVRITRDAATRGWWDKYGDTMGVRQRLYADIESGAATIREFQPGTVAGLLQTTEYTWGLLAQTGAAGPSAHQPERLVAARSERISAVLRPGGPAYEVILDEVGLRRFSVQPRVMAAQLRHIVQLAQTIEQLSIRVFPLATGMTSSMIPRSPVYLYTFPDQDDPMMAIEELITSNQVHTEPDGVERCLARYETVRDAALSEASSLTLIADLAAEITD
jgi:transcriptional regulator with XRE-family HTH domain